MTGYADMDAGDLRAELEGWHQQIVRLARAYRQAVQAEDAVWAEGVGQSLDAALRQEHSISTLLRVGAVA